MSDTFERAMSEIGLFTGLYDMYGDKIHLGDRLKFSEGEWGGTDNEFVINFEEGELTLLGTVDDLDQWCFIIKKWYEK